MPLQPPVAPEDSGLVAPGTGDEIPLTPEEEEALLEQQLLEEERAAGIAADPAAAQQPGFDPAGTAGDPGQVALEIGALLRQQADQVHQQVEQQVVAAAAQIGEAIMAQVVSPETLNQPGLAEPALAEPGLEQPGVIA